MFANLLAAASLVIAIVALGFAIVAWRRPFPPDPTSIPRFGRADHVENIGDAATADRFFNFIRVNAGRKLLIYVCQAGSLEHGNQTMTRESLVGNIRSDRLVNTLYVPERPDKKNATGISYQQGFWMLRGYFASAGVVQVAQGGVEHRLTPLGDDEAVA